jgi:hypothetical protein
MPGTLIGSISVSPQTARPGESIHIQVLDPQGKAYGPDSGVTIMIQGAEAPARYEQFATAGKHTIVAIAIKGSVSETATATVTIQGEPLTFRPLIGLPLGPGSAPMPMLLVRQNYAQHYEATFSLGTPITAKPPPAKVTAATPVKPVAATMTVAPDVFKGIDSAKITAIPEQVATTTGGLQVKRSGQYTLLPIPLKPPSDGTGGASYRWDFGDGTQATTSAPSVTHDYFHAVSPGNRALSFDVTCTIVHDNITVQRTLVLYSAYDMCQRRGTTVPHAESDTFFSKTSDGTALTATIFIYNIESTPLELTHMAWVPIYEDSSAAPPAPNFVAFATPITIAAESSNALGVRIAISDLKAAVPRPQIAKGVMVYYKGQLGPLFSQPIKSGPLNVAGLQPELRPPNRVGSFLPVRLSRFVSIQLNDRQLAVPFRPIIPIDLNAATTVLKAVATGSGAAPVTHAVDPATNTISLGMQSRALTPLQMAQARQALTSGFHALSAQTGAP